VSCTSVGAGIGALAAIFLLLRHPAAERSTTRRRAWFLIPFARQFQMMGSSSTIEI